MADPVTTNIQLAVPTRGSDVGTWDVPVNGDMAIIDNCFGAVTSLTLSNSLVALTISQAQAAVLSFSGTLTANVDVVIPNINKQYLVDNQTTGNFYVRVLPSGATAAVAPPQGVITPIIVYGTVSRFLNLPDVGVYVDYGTTTVPSWITASSNSAGAFPFLNCDGTSFSSVLYPILAQRLGGTTLPDLRGRSRAFLNQGTGRITAAISGIDGNTLLSAGGVASIGLNSNQLPNISPTFTGTPATITVASTTSVQGTAGNAGSGSSVIYVSGVGALTSIGGYTPAGSVSGFGGNLDHNNMPPTQMAGITLIRAG